MNFTLCVIIAMGLLVAGILGMIAMDPDQMPVSLTDDMPEPSQQVPAPESAPEDSTGLSEPGQAGP